VLAVELLEKAQGSDCWQQAEEPQALTLGE